MQTSLPLKMQEFSFAVCYKIFHMSPSFFDQKTKTKKKTNRKSTKQRKQLSLTLAFTSKDIIYLHYFLTSKDTDLDATRVGFSLKSKC